MRTVTPKSHSEEVLAQSSKILTEEIYEQTIAVPLQKMFDEFMTFISKTDFE
mgnify:CR=1 FL=1